MAGDTTTANTTAVPHQGILQGLNPSHYNAADPIALFIIQASIIIVACRLLHWPLSKVRQPRVIAEVIGGIILGPTVFGRIPGFKNAIFPTASMPVLNMAANLGLILFLFLVGLEVDLRMLTSNWRVAAGVGTLGMVLPFGLGCAIALGLYNQFSDGRPDNITFGVYLLFVGVAMAITAFPVLARILTELKLLQTNVGTITLSAGVANDVVGWILLALTVALVNAGSGLTALYVLLVCLGYVLALVYIVRPAFLWLLRRDGSIENGPTQSMVGLTLLMVLASAFFTDIIGVHAIFGGFLIGLICPHEGGFAVKLTEKVEDLVTVLFLPLYFALSGLNTNIALLDSGIIWGYVIGIIVLAFFGKIVGGTLAAKLCGLVWRESFTIGVLMSCKGLVELIVLNIGLQAGILSPRVFTMFVVMALITTFATTPLVTLLYPPWYQKKITKWRRGEIDWDGNSLRHRYSSTDGSLTKPLSISVSKITVLLRLDNLPAIFTFVDLLGDSAIPQPKVHRKKALRPDTIPEEEEPRPVAKRRLEVHGERLIELSQRTSAVMQVSEVNELQDRDPVLNVFRTFGAFHSVAVSAAVSIAPEDSFAEVITAKASTQSSDLLFVPWSETGAMAEAEENAASSSENRFVSYQHNQFISKVLAHSPCSTAIMVDRGFGADRGRTMSMRSFRKVSELANVVSPVTDPSHHIFFPFFGGVDDRVALRIVLQMLTNVNVTATIVQIVFSPNAVPDPGLELPAPVARRSDIPSNLSLTDLPSLAGVESYGSLTSSAGLNSADSAFFETMQDSVPSEWQNRVLFESVKTSQPLHYAIIRARSEVGLSSQNAGDLVVLGRCLGDSRPHIRAELVRVLATLGSPQGAGTETRQCLGDTAEALIVANVKASVLVFQAGGKALESEMDARGTAGFTEVQRNPGEKEL